MRKLTLLILLMFSGVLLTACGGGEKKADPPPTDDAEVITQIERFWQLDDTNPDTPADQRLRNFVSQGRFGKTGGSFPQISRHYCC